MNSELIVANIIQITAKTNFLYKNYNIIIMHNYCTFHRDEHAYFELCKVKYL